MNRRVVNFAEKLELVPEPWSPRVVAEVNDHLFKIARIQGEFIWHAHPESDEAFIVLAGEMEIELRDRRVRLRAGELFVVPRGVEHRPVAVEECHILLVEPRGVLNTGDAGGRRTVDGERWV